jgi:hypothetical protein
VSGQRKPACHQSAQLHAVGQSRLRYGSTVGDHPPHQTEADIVGIRIRAFMAGWYTPASIAFMMPWLSLE